MKNESKLEANILHRLPALYHIVLVIVAICFGGWYVAKSENEFLQAADLRQANDENESRRIAEIEAIKGRLRTVDSKLEQACVNAAGFHYPEESPQRELARMRRVEICVNQLAKPAAH